MSAPTSTSPAITTPTTVSVSTVWTVITTISNVCPDLAPIAGGTISPSGPYVANVSVATFSCFGGYALVGPANISCGPAATWEGRPPYCLPVPVANSVQVVNNNNNSINVEGETFKVPSWTLIALCVLAGVVCLLILACIIVYCIKVTGCCRGSNRRHIRSAAEVRPWPEAYHSPQPPPSRGQTAPDNIEYGHDAEVKKFRREAKMPSNRVWMPHTNQIRNINTSTK